MVDLQTDLIGLDASRIVALLLDEARYVAFPGVTHVVDVAGQRWVVRVQQLSAVPAHVLGSPVGDLRHEQATLLRAIDILTHGF